MTYTFFNPDDTVFSIENYQLSTDTHQEVFKDNGFASFDWIELMLSEEGKKQFSTTYWDELLQFSPIKGIVAKL